jgi:phytoene dehydrogenase-like protein
MTPISRRGFLQGAALTPLALTSLGGVPQQTTRTPGDRFDVVVAGAGHNSLVCSAYLAKAGYKVLVLEGRPTIGGGCKTQEVCLPGFKEDLCSTMHGAFRGNPLLRDNEINVRDYGYGEWIEPDPVMHIPFLDGKSITIWHDLDRTYESIVRVSQKDADTFRRLVPEYKQYTGAPPTERAKMRRAGVWQRLTAMSGYDACREVWDTDYLRSANLTTGHFGGGTGADPGSGGSAFSLLGEHLTGRPIPKGGSGTLSVALGRFIEAHNGIILTNKPVTELIIDGGKCVGVHCADGSEYRADKAVVSTIHVKHLVDMAPPELWGDDFLEGVRLFQPEQAMFSFHYATKEPPKYPLAAGGTISTCESALPAKPERHLSLTYDNARGVVNLDDPIPLQIVSPTVVDPSRAPDGYHTVKIEGTLPYALKEGPKHWDDIKEEVAARLLNHLRGFAPNLTPDKILAKFLESPLDIERMNPAMWHGSAHMGANTPGQAGANRPVPGWGQYRMPIAGLYQTGGCTAPGGSITGTPGRNAAAVILKDFGTTIEQVVGKPSSKA